MEWEVTPLVLIRSLLVVCLVPSQPPENVNAMAVTSQSILVLWNPPPSSDQNGVLIGYKVLYRVVRDDEGICVHISAYITRRSDVYKAGDYDRNAYHTFSCCRCV